MDIVEWLRGPMFKIYCSYALSSWSDRMWWFAGGIFMKDLSGSKHDNLMLTGVFTFALSGSVVAFGAAVGRWVDSTPRLKAVRVALVVQNSMLVVCAVTVAILFACWDDILAVWDGNLLILLQIVIVLTASISRVASIATMIIMQKDWIVVLADGDLNHLAKVNSAFRAIDLMTQVVAPVVVGVVQDQISKLTSAVSIAVWNICSMIVEYYLLWLIYKENPNLSVKSVKLHSPRCTARYADHAECPEDGGKKNWLQYRYHAYCYDWHTYIKHPVRMAGLALALLYMTVMGFDAVTTAYGNTQISTSLLGIAQGLAAVFGIMGSLSFPPLRRIMGLTSAGILGLALEVSSLVSCVVSIWLPGSPFDISTVDPSWRPDMKNETEVKRPDSDVTNNTEITSILAFFGGVIVSRYGLWLADISITQIMQEGVSENKRGVIHGVQDSLNMGMDMLKSMLVILFPYPQQFGFLIVLSYVSVCLGLLSYLMYFWSSYSKSGEHTTSPGKRTSTVQ